MATIQSFPTDYVFKGPIMALNYVKFQYRQVGNAVPIFLAEAVGKAILKQIGSIQTEGIQKPEVIT